MIKFRYPLVLLLFYFLFISSALAQNAWTNFSTTIETSVSGASFDYNVSSTTPELSGVLAVRFLSTFMQIPGHADIQGWHYQLLDPSLAPIARLFKRGGQAFGLVPESRCPSGQARREFTILALFAGQEIPVGETLTCSNAYVNGQPLYPPSNIEFILRIDGSPYAATQAALQAQGLLIGEVVVARPN